MPGPFRGMAPWLEAAHVWPGFHSRLINESVAILQPQLRARGYFIDSGERVWLSQPGRPVYPANAIFRTESPAHSRGVIDSVVESEPGADATLLQMSQSESLQNKSKSLSHSLRSSTRPATTLSLESSS
jgi:hypothetical protein